MDTNPARLWPRLGAAIYDSLLLIALWFFGTALLLPFVPSHEVPPGNVYFQIYLVGLAFLFYAWFWTHGGQTLGMRAWGLRVVDLEGRPLRLAGAFVRFLYSIPVAATLGLALLFRNNPYRQALHDRLSKTRLIALNIKRKSREKTSDC